MTSFLRQLAARQRAEAKRKAERLAKRRAARIARKVARIADTQADGLDDLPLEVALAIEENSEQPVKTEPALECDDSVENLVSRLTAIRERIWRLQAMFAVSLSHDSAVEANRYLQLFQTLAAQLKVKDPTALDNLVRGHESLLLAPALPIKQTIPIDTQRLCELRWEVSQAPTVQRAQRASTGDGLDWMVS